MKKFESLIDINKRKGFPRSYKFNQFIRWFTMFFGVMAIAYAMWVMFNKIDGDSSRIVKFSPIIILLLAFNSVIRNLFTLNSLKLFEDKISFRYIGKVAVIVKWSDFRQMKLSEGKRKAVSLIYLDNNAEKEFRFFLSFPHILEVINSIAEMAPQMELDEFMRTIVMSEKEKTTKVKFDTSKIMGSDG